MLSLCLRRYLLCSLSSQEIEGTLQYHRLILRVKISGPLGQKSLADCSPLAITDSYTSPQKDVEHSSSRSPGHSGSPGRSGSPGHSRRSGHLHSRDNPGPLRTLRTRLPHRPRHQRAQERHGLLICSER